ncbi:MAG: OmpA family protein [Candidatus Zixiibacteriota bacterium]
MKLAHLFIAGMIVLTGLLSEAAGQGKVDMASVEKLMDSARLVEAHVFSPKTSEKASKQFEQARQTVKIKGSETAAANYLVKTREFTENALKNTDVCKLTLREYLPPRDKAKAANAEILVPVLFTEAEAVFISAAGKVESGDVKGALKEAAKASPLYDIAEMEAIRADILGPANKLIAAAVYDEAPKYALTCLDKAKTAREKANAILTADRYNRKEAAIEAARAEYEALHASNIAQSVRSLNRNDQAWEKLMLVYEIQMDRVGAALGMDYLPFDKGPGEAADSLIAGIRAAQGEMSAEAGKSRESVAALQKTIDQLQREREDLTARLSAVMSTIGGDLSLDEPADMIHAIDSSLTVMIAERSQLAQQVAAEQSKLTQLTEEHQEVSSELQQRQAREERLIQAKAMIDPTQGEILVSGANDIVLRLSGLSFAAGKSELTEEHVPLLEKVKQIIALFPESPLVVEGHTDDRGDPAANTQLSEKRAFAVMQYLRQAMSIPSDRIRAIGYGSEKPIASQATAEGRAKNRRIDIVIMQ